MTSEVTTGQSLPKTRRPPAFSMLRHEKPREARSGPMLRLQTSALFWSGLACSGCIDAITPSAWKRG